MNIVMWEHCTSLLTMRFFDVAKFITLNPSHY